MTIWKLNGICYREMAEAAKLLAKLAKTGEIEGTTFDLDTLEIRYNEKTGDVDLADGEGNTTAEQTYSIIRFFEDPDKDPNQITIATGLTLEEAKEHCNDPETSSYTATYPNGCGGDDAMIREWHDQKKHWYDGFTKEEI